MKVRSEQTKRTTCNKKGRFFCSLLFLTLLLTLICNISSLAGSRTNSTTGYRVIIEDDANLLTAAEEEQLLTDLLPATEYGHALVKTISRNPSTTEAYARSWYHSTVGTDSGSLLLIDMDKRILYLFSDGANYRMIGDSKADIITDNIYRYASRGDYAGCAAEAFAEITALLSGYRIAQPMKYISNAFLALFLGFLLTYLLVTGQRKQRAADTAEVMASLQSNLHLAPPAITMTRETRTFSPIRVSSGGGGGGHHGGGGGFHGGGGGHSGGGGGHRF